MTLLALDSLKTETSECWPSMTGCPAVLDNRVNTIAPEFLLDRITAVCAYRPGKIYVVADVHCGAPGIMARAAEAGDTGTESTVMIQAIRVIAHAYQGSLQ